MKNMTVYVVTTHKGKTSVRTEPVNLELLAAEGKQYRQETAVLTPKAARKISVMYNKQVDSK
jgi:hypothetical protein